jgi:hypothetical protein
VRAARAVLLLLLAAAARAGDDEILLWAPFAHGTRQPVWQGNDVGTHSDVYNRHAVDFSPLPIGTPVHASAPGQVVFVKEDSTGPTGRVADNNEVIVRHPDGFFVTYMHLKEDGAAVGLGDEVLEGDLIGWSGNTGSSVEPHLHVNVLERRGGKSLPWRFHELPAPPTKGDMVLSRNYPVREVLRPVRARAVLYDLLARIDAREAIAKELAALAKRKAPASARAVKGRRDLARRFTEAQDRLIARYAADADAAIERLDSLALGGGVPEKLAAAVLGSRDYKGPAARAGFRNAWSALRKEAGYDEAWQSLQPTLRRREAIAPAVKAELAAREATGRKAKAAWASARKAWKRALASVGDEALAERLAKRAESLGPD